MDDRTYAGLRHVVASTPLFFLKTPRFFLNSSVPPLVTYHWTGGWKFGNGFRNIFTPGQETLYSLVSYGQIRGCVVTWVMLLAPEHIFTERFAEKLHSIPHLLDQF